MSPGRAAFTPRRRGVVAGLGATLGGVFSRAVSKPLDAPDFGPNVVIADPTTPPADLQAKLDAIFGLQERDQFSARRFAVLFKPGRYRLDCNVGYFTQVAGLGALPDDVVIDGHVRVGAGFAKGSALNTFWRSAENMTVRPPDGLDRWAASQAAPYRRMHLHGDLALDDGGWSSGGFIADSVVTGTVRAGTQQQYLTRSSRIGGWTGANWNMVFAGVEGAPPDSFPDPPVTTLAEALQLREKPFLSLDTAGRWALCLPDWRAPHAGPSWTAGAPPSRLIGMEAVFIARPDMTAGRINAQLRAGKHLVLTPGIYRLDAPLVVSRPDTVVLGRGLATLRPEAGTAALIVDAPGAAVAALLVDAGEQSSPVLMQVGRPGAKGAGDAGTSLHDLFFRIGGAEPGRAVRALEVNADGVFADDLWLWRADHGDEATGRVHVGWTVNPADEGLVVNGDRVTFCGLFVEHFRRTQTAWNGECGATYFYQSELPYDPPSQDALRPVREGRGWPSYRVAGAVRSHFATGLGIYANFTADPSITVASAVEVPRAKAVVIEHVTTISLGGGEGVISHCVDDQGEAAGPGHIRSTLVRFDPL